MNHTLLEKFKWTDNYQPPEIKFLYFFPAGVGKYITSMW